MERDKRGSKKRSKGRRSTKKSKDLDTVKSDPTHSRKSRKSRNERHKKIKSSSALPDYHHHDHEGRKASKKRTLSRSDLVHIICEFFADDFWETAWDICKNRFVHKSASIFIMSDLRDSWLSIIEMQWMDTDPLVPHGLKLLDFQIEDRPPLPPKFDSWSHGALETIPRTCRESIMDPFLREPLPWLLGELQRNPWELPAATKSSAELDISDYNFYGDESGVRTGRKMSANASHAAYVARPTSPVPTEEEDSDSRETESTWSLATSVGSLSRLNDLKFVDSGHKLKSSSSSGGSLRYTVIPKESVIKASSIEFLYPSKLPVPEFRASSEFTYNVGSKSVSRTGSGLVAFKLPHQTSSESKRVHEQRKKFLEEKKTSTASSSSSKSKHDK